MVDKALKTLSKAEKEMEHLTGASNNNQNPAEQAVREMRQIAEASTFSAIKATSEWGKNTLQKTKEFTEEICL